MFLPECQEVFDFGETFLGRILPPMAHTAYRPKLLKVLLLALFATPCAGLFSQASAQVFVIFPERQQERKSARWSLSNWLETKKTIAAQDAWLARHTNKVPVDITYGFDVRSGQLGHELDVSILGFGVHARYAQGMNYLREQATPELSAQNKGGELGLQLRLFGGNPQNTSLTVKGVYEYNQLYSLASGFTGAYGGYAVAPELQIYFAPWLGVRGEWRKRFSQKRITARGAHVTGNGYFLVGFLEMGSVRLEGGIENRDWMFTDDSGGALSFVDSVYLGRLRLFF